MKVFQILNDEILIIDGDKQYQDTIEHFKEDSSVADLPSKVIYDDVQKYCVVEDQFKKYPDTTFDGYIAKVSDYITAKTAREYVPPTFDELRKQALNYQYSQYVDKREAIVTVNNMGFATDSDGQRDWQVALTLIGDSGQYKVYDDASKSTKLATVTRDQMIAAGNAARAQQLAAYTDFISIRNKINNCKTADDLKTYLPPEKA